MAKETKRKPKATEPKRDDDGMIDFEMYLDADLESLKQKYKNNRVALKLK